VSSQQYFHDGLLATNGYAERKKCTPNALGRGNCTMENLVISDQFWCGKRVLVTGHSGFKGGWLSLWLNELGARVYGYSLAPTPESEFYNRVYSNGFIGEEEFADITDFKNFSECINKFKPDIIFNLAAQPLVRASYDEPASTFAINTMGVVNLLEAVRRSPIEPTIVNVTTDKVYSNKEWIWAYREYEELGGNDPYSASKACSEIITNSYVKSFFKSSSVKIATARAGNVIGGGDMSKDRLVPDYLRAITNGSKVLIMNPQATRPWQHVLEPVLGYIQLAEKMASSKDDTYTGPWNFGPSGDPVSVIDVVTMLSEISNKKNYKIDLSSNPHEAQCLMLDSAKARNILGWKPRLTLETALKMTFSWFQLSIENADMQSFAKSQIKEYQSYE